VISVVGVLAVIQYSELVVRSGYTRSVVVLRSMWKVMKSSICRVCWNPVSSTGRTSVDIDASANPELMDVLLFR